MKNILISIATAFVGVLIALFIFKPQQTTIAKLPQINTAYDRVMATGVLRCGYAMWAPISFLKDPNTGSYSGFIPDYLAVLAKNSNLKIEFVEETGWGAQTIEGLKTGRIDAFCTGFNKNAQRGQHVLYTDTIFYNPIYAYVRPDDHRFDADLNAVNNAAITQSTMDGEATDMIAKNMFPLSKTFALPQNSEMNLLYMNVAQQKADIVFSDPSPANSFNQKNPLLQLRRVSDTPVMLYTIGIAVNNDEPKLQAMLNAALIELQASGQIKSIIKKYDPTMDGVKVGKFVFDAP